MKGIILSGGNGTRLSPVTTVINKHLLPVYNKPMIYYPLSTLMLFGIKEILIITKSSDLHLFKKLLGDGSQLGIKIDYAVQDEAKGIADAFLISEDFIGKDSVTLILGDNIFYGENMPHMAQNFNGGAKVFLYRVSDPHRYGIAQFYNHEKITNIVEKPQNPPSNWAVTGLYMYDNNVINIAKSITPSARGELEITCVNNEYIKRNDLHYTQLSRGIAWFDVGTVDSLLQASTFVHTIESRQGLKISSIEEVSQNMKVVYENSIAWSVHKSNNPSVFYTSFSKRIDSKAPTKYISYSPSQITLLVKGIAVK